MRARHRRRPILGGLFIAPLLALAVALGVFAGVEGSMGRKSATAVESGRVLEANGFEGTPRTWFAPGEPRAVRVPWARSGKFAVRLQSKERRKAWLTDVRDSVSGLKRGQRVRTTVWVRAPKAPADVRLRLEVKRSGAVILRAVRDARLNRDGWVRLQKTLTVAKGGSSLGLSIRASDTSRGRLLVVDDLRVDTVPSTPAGDEGTSADGCALDQKLVPNCGVLWGMYTTQRSPQEGWAQPFLQVESAMGRPFDVVKRYHDWSNAGGNGQFPDKHEQKLGASGERILYFSWVSNNWSEGTVARWRDIAAGRYDESVIKPQARRLKQWGKKVIIDFDHEMDGVTRSGNGTPAEYAAAYRHIVDVMRAEGVRNVVWAWVPTGYLGNAAKIKASYPGDDYVDWLGYDPYNFYTCHNSAWETPYESMVGYYRWLEQNGFDDKPIILGEYGTAHPTSDPARARQWYEQVPDALARLPRIKAAVQWDSGKSGVCNFQISEAPAVLEGYARAAMNPTVRVD